MYSRWTRIHVFLLNKNTYILGEQEYMYSCWTRIHVFLFNKNTCILVGKSTCILVEQEYMFSCWTRMHVVLLNKDTGILNLPFVFMCCGESIVFMQTHCLIEICVVSVDPTCSNMCVDHTRRRAHAVNSLTAWHFVLPASTATKFTACFLQCEDWLDNKNTCILVNKNTYILVQQEYMYPCWTRIHVFLLNKNTRLLVEQEYTSSCWTRIHVFRKISSWIRIHVFVCTKNTCILVQAVC